MTLTTYVITVEVIPSANFKFTDNEESLSSRITVISVGVYKYHYFKLRGGALHKFYSSASTKLFV